MLKYIIKRLINLIPVLIVLTLLVFLLMYLTPGDPALIRLSSQGANVTDELLAATRAEMGLDQSFFTRYFSWVGGILHGDFGMSYIDDMPIFPKLLDALMHTLALASASTVVSVMIAIPIGIFTAVKKDSIPDNIVRIFTFTGNAMPNFLIALLLMYLFCIRVRLFPVIAKGSVQGLMLPALSLSIPMISKFARQTRADVLQQLNEEYVIGMHARGVKERVILYKNVLHNALGSILTIISLQIRVLIGGSVVTEVIFRWPGVGSLIMDSIGGCDYPTVQGAVLILATLQILVNLATDISYCIIDKRIELE
ncbi:ABC transporter permease [Lachnospiraceae bacterium NSJ-143]|nr:ABC transporter permease [Lachnospiraceae bacterium NSJ-143]